MVKIGRLEKKMNRINELILELRYGQNKISPKSILLIILILALISSFVLTPRLTGMVVSEMVNNYTDDISISFDSDSEYFWYLDEAISLNSVKVSGKGYGKVYIEHDEERYLIYENSIKIK